MRFVLPGFLAVVLLGSCATAPVSSPKPLVRLVMENPMSGKRAAEPILDSASRITTRTSPSHIGTDFTARKVALPVFAAKEGTILSNTTALSNSGASTITVLNSDGSVSRYLHVGSPLQTGDVLIVGEPFAKVLLAGQPGYGATNTGAHLHYEQFETQALFDRRKYMTTDEVMDQWKD